MNILIFELHHFILNKDNPELNYAMSDFGFLDTWQNVNEHSFYL